MREKKSYTYLQHMKKNHNLLSVSLLVLFIQACISVNKPIQPEYKKPLEAIVADISKQTSFTKFSISSINKNSSDVNSTCELKIELTNAAVSAYTTDDLDSLSKRITRILKRQVININSFDWISVLYKRDDGLPVSDSSQQYGFVYRPTAIK